jgi:hypothetical protein
VSGLVFVTTDDCHLCEHGREVLDVERSEGDDTSDEAAGLASGYASHHQK